MRKFVVSYLLLILACLIPSGELSVLSDLFNKASEDQVDQVVNEGLEPEDFIPEMNGGALTDFFNSLSVIEVDKVSEKAMQPVDDNSPDDLIHVQDFLTLTDHELPQPRSNLVAETVKTELLKTTDSLFVEEESSTTAFPTFESASESSRMQESTPLVLISEPPVSTTTSVTSTVQPSSTLLPEVSESTSTSTSVQPSSTLTSAPVQPSSTSTSAPVQPSSTSFPVVSTLPSTSESLSLLTSSTSSPEPVFGLEHLSSESSSPTVDDVNNDATDSFGSLMMELDKLNILNEAVAALNTPEDSLILPDAQDRTDVIEEDFAAADDEDEENDFFTDIFNWLG